MPEIIYVKCKFLLQKYTNHRIRISPTNNNKSERTIVELLIKTHRHDSQKRKRKKKKERDKHNNIGRIRVNAYIHIFKVPKYKLILFLSHYC